MYKSRKLPSDEILTELIKAKMTHKEILVKYKLKGTFSQTISNAATRNNLIVNKAKREKKGERNEELEKHKYQDLEIFKVGDIVIADKQKWAIESINNDAKKLYHCKNKTRQSKFPRDRYGGVS